MAFNFVVGPMYSQQYSRLLCNFFAFRGLTTGSVRHDYWQCVKGKFVPVPSYLSVTPCRSMSEDKAPAVLT
jgi:hypothetical protein